MQKISQKTAKEMLKYLDIYLQADDILSEEILRIMKAISERAHAELGDNP